MDEFTRVVGPRERTAFHKRNRTNKHGFLGIKFSKRDQRYSAYIRNKDGAKVYCGNAKTAEEAARCYDRKAIELYGSEAVLNFDEADAGG